jgi:hypothetical protein
MGECDGVGAVHREVAVSRGVYSARVARLARPLSQPFLYPVTEELPVTRGNRHDVKNGHIFGMAALSKRGRPRIASV